MKKLNNKGLSIIELLVCFVIVAIISITLLNIIMEYKGVQETENIKNIIRTYKDEVTNVIEKDIIRKTLSNAEVKSYSGNKCTITLTFKNKVYKNCTLANEEDCYKKELVVYSDNTKNYIQYPDIIENSNGTEEVQTVRYVLPKTTDIYVTDTSSSQSSQINKIKTNDISFKYLPQPEEDGDSFVTNGVFHLYIPIEHSEIDGTYAIDIITPVTR